MKHSYVMNLAATHHPGGGAVTAKRKIRFLNPFLMLTICFLALFSCKKESIPAVEQEVAFALNIPEHIETIEETRHGTPNAGTAEERKISTLTYLVFRSNNTVEAVKTITVNGSNQSSDPAWDPATSKLRLNVTPGQKRIYMIANWNDPSFNEMPKLTSITDSNVLVKITRNHKFNSQLPRTPLVMSGRKEINVTTAGTQNFSVDLLRQCARVDIYPTLAQNVRDANIAVKFTGIRFLNIPSESFLFKSVTGNINPSNDVWALPSFTNLNFDVTSTTVAGQYGQGLYVPEYFGASRTYTALEISATYNGQLCYYLVYINGQVGSLPAQYAIERNHIYAYVVKITGVGSPTGHSFSTLSSPMITDDPGVKNIASQTYIR